METVVFKEKIRRPEPSGLSRDRLERPLLADDGPTVTLVLAPAGAGKTTLLTRIAATGLRPAGCRSRAGTPTHWPRG